MVLLNHKNGDVLEGMLKTEPEIYIKVRDFQVRFNVELIMTEAMNINVRSQRVYNRGTDAQKPRNILYNNAELEQ